MSLVLIMIIIPEDIAIVQSTRNQFSVIAKNAEMFLVSFAFAAPYLSFQTRKRASYLLTVRATGSHQMSASGGVMVPGSMVLGGMVLQGVSSQGVWS